MSTETRPTQVEVTDFNMPFWSMVEFMVKWTLASIPAFVILFIMFFFAAPFIAAFFAGLVTT